MCSASAVWGGEIIIILWKAKNLKPVEWTLFKLNYSIYLYYLIVFVLKLKNNIYKNIRHLNKVIIIVFLENILIYKLMFSNELS